MIAIIACWSDKVKNISDIVSDFWYENEIFLMQDLLHKKWLCRGDFDKFDGIIISWSPLTLTVENRDKYLKLFPFIGEINTPILGICFGHQVIGHSFWSIYCNGEFVDGQNRIQLLNRGEDLFKWIRKKVFFENHEQQITLPTEFRLLAYSENCQNESMKHKNKEIYWVQFHPELSGSSWKRLIHNFLEKC